MIGYINFGKDAAGESKDANHKDWVKLVSLSQSITRPVASTAGSHRSSDRATLGDVVCVKELDSSTTKLLQFACEGKHLPEVVIEITTSVGAGTEATLLKVTLNDVVFSNISLSGQFTGNHHPTESVSMNFSKIAWSYTKYDQAGKSGGNVDGKWNVMENKTF